MAIIRAQVEIPHTTGLVEDTVVNTLYFDADATLVSATALALLIQDFYNADTTSGDRISEYLSDLLLPGATVKFYNMANPTPRIPFAIIPIARAVTASGSLPQEVAFVLSFQAALASGSPPARRRGRIYLGPLATDAAATDTARPTVPFMTTVRLAADRLRVNSNASGTPWGVYSRTDNVLRPVLGGWTDNEWDTQRRRGRVATAKTFWPA